MYTNNRAEINLKDFVLVKELGLGSIGIARCYKDKKSNKDIYVFKQLGYISSTNFPMQFLKININFPPLLRYSSVSKLSHKENNSIFLITTRYLDNGSLEKQISSQLLNPTEKTIAIFGIAAALYKLHSNDLFHGHLYPSNILFNDQKEPQVCDFSLFQLHRYDTQKIIEINKSSFLSPEQLFNSKIDAKTDVFSYGKVLLYILSDNLYYLDFYTELISKCCDKNPLNRPNFSDILHIFTSSSDFILEGSDMQKITDYQRKLFPNGFHIKSMYMPKPIESRHLFLLPPVLNEQIKSNFEDEKSKNPAHSKSSISIFSIEQNFFNNAQNFSKQYHITVPVYNDQQRHSLKPHINEDRKKKPASHFFSSLHQPLKPSTTTIVTERSSHSISDIQKQQAQKDAFNRYQTVVFKDEIESRIDANLKISADCGNVESQFKYGSLLLNGPTDMAQEGARYIKFAADGGYLHAQKLYAYLTRNGIIVPQSAKLCDHYMKLAADSGDLTSQIEYATILEKQANDMINASNVPSNSASSSTTSSSSLSSSSSTSSVAHVLKSAAKYYFLAAQQNDRNAQFIYGTFLEDGKGVQVDVDEAMRYYRMSAEQGYTIAQLKLAFLLRNEESVRFLKLAADSSNTYAMVTYAKLLIRTCLNKKKLNQMKKYVKEAMCYIEKAVAIDSHMALYLVGCLMFYFCNVFRTRKLNFMGKEIETAEKSIFSDDDESSDYDDEEEEEEKDDRTIESTSQASSQEEEESSENKNDQNQHQQEIDADFDANNKNNFDVDFDAEDDQNRKYYKVIKCIMNVIERLYTSETEPDSISQKSDSKIRHFFSQMFAKNLTHRDCVVAELKKNGLAFIKKSASLGNRRAQFQVSLIGMDFSKTVGEMDINFFNNLINETPEHLTNITANKNKKFTFVSDDSFFSANKTSYFDGYWDDNRPKIDKLDDEASESLEQLNNASNGGLSDAQYLIGLILIENSDNPTICHKLKSDTSDFLSASDYIKKAADCGSVRAQLAYALIIDDGHGNPKNLREASKYYKMAADGGNPSAMVNIGFMLFDGRGINRNRKEALEYMKEAADMNLTIACYKYGSMLYNGQGTVKDVKESVKYFEKVIKNEARFTSPGIHHTSEVSPVQMMQESARCIRSAAEQGVPEAMRVYAIMLLKEICFTSNVSESFRWFKKAAKLNDPIALNFVANRIFKTGEGDRSLAVKMLKTAADNGYNIAQFNYAMIVEEGDESIDLKQNFKEAALYYKKAADQNYAPAQLHYAMMLEIGEEGVEKDVKKAAFYYRKAARSQSDAMIHYGKMLRKGTCVRKNVKLAIKYFRTAAKMGNKEGQYMFARMLQKGEGIECNKNLALSLFKEAASQPMISSSLCTSKAQFRYAESLIEKGCCNFLNYNEATRFYLAASDYEEAPEMAKFKMFDKKVRKIRITLLFILLTIYIIQKLFL